MNELYNKILSKAEADFLEAKNDLIVTIKDCLKYKGEVDRLNELCLAETYTEIVNMHVVKTELKASVAKMEEVYVGYVSAQMVLAVAKCPMFKGIVEAKNSNYSGLFASRTAELVNYRNSFPLSDMSKIMENMSEALDSFEAEGAKVSSNSEHTASDFVERMIDSIESFETDSNSVDYALYLMQHYDR